MMVAGRVYFNDESGAGDWARIVDWLLRPAVNSEPAIIHPRQITFMQANPQRRISTGYWCDTIRQLWDNIPRDKDHLALLGRPHYRDRTRTARNPRQQDHRRIRKRISPADIGRTGGWHRRHRYKNPKYMHAGPSGGPNTHGDYETVHVRTLNPLSLVRRRSHDHRNPTA